ncbi:ABC transporter permease [Geodermatophilus sp. SYSU D00758]
MRKVIWKGLLARKLRLALTAVSISLGVAFVSGTFVLGDTMTATFDQLYEGLTEGTDVTVRGESAFTDTSTLGATRPFDESLLAEVEQVEGVEAAAGAVTGYALILDRGGEPVQPGGAPTLGANFPSAEETDAGLTAGFTLRSGDAPAGPGEVALDAATARDHGFAPGDPVTILFADGPRDFVVSGIAGFGEADNLAGATMAAFDLATAQQVLGKVGLLDGIDVRAEDGVPPGELRDRLAAALPDGLEAVTSEQVVAENSAAVADALGFFTTGLLGFAAVSLLVGALIIWNTFSILVAQRTRELALLRAVGASRRQVRTSVVVEALVIGLVAAALGLGLGIGVAVGLRAALGAIGLEVPTTTLQVEPRTVVAALLVGVVVTVLAALLPARQATRVPPVAALRAVDAPARPVGRVRPAVGAVLTVLGAAGLTWAIVGEEQLAAAGLGTVLTLAGVLTLAPPIATAVTRVVGGPLTRLGGTTAALARRNALRNPRRTANTATALMIGLALVSTVTVVASSMKASVADVLADTSRADFILKAAGQTAQGLPPQLAEELRGVDGVGTVAQLRVTTVQRDGATTAVTGLDPATVESAADLEVSSGAVADLGDGSVLVSDAVAGADGLAVGDAVEIVFSQTGAQEFTVAGTYGNTTLLGSDYVVTLDALAANGGAGLDTAVLVVAEDGADPADVRAGLEAVTAAYPIAQLDDAESFTESQAQTIDQLLAIVTMLLALAVVIALLGIVNTLALSVFERTRELGLLRAVGTTRRQVRAVVRWESVIVAVLGALLGAVLGLASGAALTRGLAGEGLTVLEIPGDRLGLYVLAAAVAGVLAAIGPARRAAKVDVLRAVAAT